MFCLLLLEFQMTAAPQCRLLAAYIMQSWGHGLRWCGATSTCKLQKYSTEVASRNLCKSKNSKKSVLNVFFTQGHYHTHKWDWLTFHQSCLFRNCPWKPKLTSVVLLMDSSDNFAVPIGGSSGDSQHCHVWHTGCVWQSSGGKQQRGWSLLVLPPAHTTCMTLTVDFLTSSGVPPLLLLFTLIAWQQESWVCLCLYLLVCPWASNATPFPGSQFSPLNPEVFTQSDLSGPINSRWLICLVKDGLLMSSIDLHLI